MGTRTTDELLAEARRNIAKAERITRVNIVLVCIAAALSLTATTITLGRRLGWF